MFITKAEYQILCGPNSNPTPYLGVGYEGLVFVELMVELNEKHGQGTHSTKMGPAENASKNVSPKCLPKPKTFWFFKKALSGCP